LHASAVFDHSLHSQTSLSSHKAHNDFITTLFLLKLFLFTVLSFCLTSYNQVFYGKLSEAYLMPNDLFLSEWRLSAQVGAEVLSLTAVRLESLPNCLRKIVLECAPLD